MGVIYKPYKRKLNQWKCLSGELRKDACGREIVSVEIGQKLYTDDSGEIEKKEDILEDIYLDIVKGIFSNRDSYHTSIYLGFEPQIVVSTEGALVMHNDKMSDYVEQIMAILDTIDYAKKVKVLLQTVQHEVKGEKQTPQMKKIQEYIKEKSGISFPLELIGYAIRENICENREMTAKEEEIHWLEYSELLEKAGMILAARNAGKNGSQTEKGILDELLYRFVSGQLVERA